ncbi:unnamed protein product, partial [Musa acuminata var. zebrina]
MHTYIFWCRGCPSEDTRAHQCREAYKRKCCESFTEVSALHEKTSVLWQANRLTRLLLLEVGSLPICIWVHWMDLG